MNDVHRAVFLSYASQDAAAAHAICQALRSSGIEVWFDQAGGLEHGDEWDAKIRRQIRDCIFFLPVISAHTQARAEGYFRIEWELATERAMGFAHHVPFILPIVIDGTSEVDAFVPERFRKVQWTRLPGGAVPPDVRARFLKLWAERTGVAAPAKASPAPATDLRAVPSSQADEKSIAVLPFANMSADAENEYFSDGMTEEIINALVQVPDLRVAARTSVFAFKGKADDLRTIAAKLNVRTVLEGSVRKAGNKIRITAQLINAADGFHLWSERFDRGLDDIFAVQDEIARTIAEKLKAKLGTGVQHALVTPPTDDLEAYQLYLQGRYFWAQRGAGLMKGLKCFETALARDPDYALAHAGVADAYTLLAFYGFMRPNDVVEKARAAARRAVQLDPGLAEAHNALAFIRQNFDRDAHAAIAAFERALELKPTYVQARYWYGASLHSVGRVADAITSTAEAVRLEPFSPVANLMLGWRLSAAGRVDEAFARLSHVIELDPNFSLGHWLYAFACLLKGRLDEGLAEMQRAVELSRQLPLVVAGWACALAFVGRKDEARAVLADLMRRSETEYVSPFQIATIHAHLGDEETALFWMDRAIEENDMGIAYLGIGAAEIGGMSIPLSQESVARLVARLRLKAV